MWPSLSRWRRWKRVKSMNRALLSIVFLSGLVFLICLVQNSGSLAYNCAIPYPNGRTQMLSQMQLYLMGVQCNPWFGVSLASQLLLAVSLFASAILFAHQKQVALPQRDAP